MVTPLFYGNGAYDQRRPDPGDSSPGCSTYFTTVALTSSPQGPVSPRVLTQRAW
ncbi:MAG: hypothetical protein IID37_13480 [Planctomycetes bacterium]|nr:hypothetical protein [Planctomycetota bacterium]